MEKVEKEFIELKTNFKRYIEEGTEEKKRSNGKLDKILEHVKHTNGRVKKLEVQNQIDEALNNQFKKIVSFLASIGALGGLGSFLPKLLEMMSK